MLGGHSTQLRTIYSIYISASIRAPYPKFHFEFDGLLALAKLQSPKMLDKPPSENNGLSAELLTSPLAGRHSPAIEPLSCVPPEALYTVFGYAEVILLVALASIAACLSPLTASIYYPAILSLLYEFSIPTNLTNLTITVYRVCQGLAPTFVGSISDAIGRRPAYIVCFIIYPTATLDSHCKVAILDSWFCAAFKVLEAVVQQH